MFLVDYHVHTKRCRHACGEDREYVEAAIKRGLNELGFADHVPRFYQPPNTGIKVNERGMSWPDLEKYLSSLEKLREEYRNDISIKIGLEVDYVPGWEQETEKITGQYEWDYIIGSVHFIPEWDYGYIANNKDRSSEELFPVYFEYVSRAAESKLFDILGHIDLPKRSHQPLPKPVMMELYHKLAGRLGKADAVIELNTYGFRGSKGKIGIYPEPEMLQFCYENGVRVTLGSDSHRPKDVGADFNIACDYLNKTGYQQITVFKGRQAFAVNWE